MSKIIKVDNEPFTILNNKVIRDERLTWSARGVFAYLLSQSNDWNFYETEVAKHASNGITALRSALKELEKFGYLTRKRVRNAKGQLQSSDWIITQYPKSDNSILEKPILENPIYDNQTVRSNNSKKQQLQETTTKEYIGQAEPTNAPQVPYKEIVDYLNRKARTNFKSSARANQSLIKARFNEGYTLDDFKKVIDNKIDTWLDDNQMSKYLRPVTLFGNKFDSYLNEQHKPLTAKEKDWGY